VVAFSYLFYGRALLYDGQRDEALRQFNVSQGCAPVIALCKEPSPEHRQYLRELIAAGADMALVDDHGYSALDYAVFSGDLEAQSLILEGLKQNLSNDPGVERMLSQHLSEAKLKKGYRDLFQEKLRPVLLARDHHERGLQTIRQVYADARAGDPAMRAMFDGLKFLRYADFVRFGRLPRSSDRLARVYRHNGGNTNGASVVDHIIFFSYRWINKSPNATSPDDENHTQYKKMIEAVGELMKAHPAIQLDNLGLWIVSTQSLSPQLEITLSSEISQS